MGRATSLNQVDTSDYARSDDAIYGINSIETGQRRR